MFINKSNQLYKPKRILYYIETSEEDIEEFYKGRVKGEVKKYSGAFGTYDRPGIFYIDDLSRKVIGIEYRPDDDRVHYPDDLKSVVLNEMFFYVIEIGNENRPDLDLIKGIYEEIAKDDDAHRLFSDLSIKSEPDLISVFESEKKYRILYEGNLDRDSAVDVINDDISKADNARLYKLAFYDPITGHYNWNHLVPFLEMPMDAGIKDYAFVHFDIKEFRILNEVYGHIAANRVLSNVTKAMTEADFVYASARCHNDNFAMMIKDMPEDETVRRLSDFFEKLSHLKEDENYRIYYRAGVVPMQIAVIAGNRVADAGKLAQSLGTNPNKTDIIFYTEKMHEDILWGNYIKAYVDTAIENDEFLVYLQPKFDIESEKIRGAEALIRWNYKNSEMLPPSRFIPFFEKDGSIGKIDDIVLNVVCESFAKWKNEGRELYPISVNLSRNRLYDNNIVDHLTSIVDSYGVDRALIDFELTESATYDDTDHMMGVLNELRARGFKISMDDFGTGYSSLSLLAAMPIDVLKIDKSFVDNIGTENEKENDITVIRHIISLAKELKFTCLAEGAEEKCQVDKLRILGCDIIQGYYFSRPIPIGDYEEKYL